jgi:hypothetical protein
MVTGVTASAAGRGRRFWIMAARGGLAVVVVAGGFTVWYRATYHAWPGQEVSRVHWCGRDYQAYPGRSDTWPQVASEQRWPVHHVGWYPPLGWPHQELFAAAFPAEVRHAARPPLHSCAVVVYLRTGPGKYKAYSLEGGP